MRKRFAFNLVFLIVANLLVKPVWIFGIDRVVQNRVGPAEYGSYFALLNYTILFTFILDLGLNNFNNRSIARSPERLSSFFGNLLSIKLLLSASYFLMAVMLAWWSGFGALQIKVLSILLLNQVLLTLILFFRSNLQAIQFFRTDSVISVTDKMVATIICGFMLFSDEWIELSIKHFVLAQTIGLLVATLISGALVASQAGFQFKFWSKRYTTKILKSTMPYALLVLLMSIYNRIDAVMLERLLPVNGSVQAGIYAAAYRVFDAANQFGFLFSTILLPMFALNFRRKISNSPLFELGLKSIGLFSTGVAVFCFTWDDLIVETLYHHSEEVWLQVFRLTVICFIPASLTYIAGTLLTAKGEIMALCKIALVGVVFNFFTNYFLIPAYGAFGCAIAALLTNILMFLLHMLLVVQRGAALSPASTLIRMLLFIISVFLLAGLFSYSDFHYILQWLFTLVVGLILAFMLRLFSINDVVLLLKAKQQSAR